MKNDETMNLDEIKGLIGDVSSDGEFDLESIIAEVSGEKATEAPKKAAPAEKSFAKEETTEIPSIASKAKKNSVATETVSHEIPDMSNYEDEFDNNNIEEDKKRSRKEQRVALKAEKAAAKKAEREAKRLAAAEAAEYAAAETAEYAEDEFEQTEQNAAEDYIEQPQQEQPRMTRKEKKAAKRAAELEEEEEEIELRDPEQAQRAYNSRARGLSVRSLLVFILTAIAVYISIAPNFEQLPIPAVLNIADNAVIGIGALMLLQFVSIFVGIDVFGMGFYNLFHGMPDRNTLVSVSVVAALLHSASILVLDNGVGVSVPYVAISMLLLYAAMREERNRFSAKTRTYKALCSAEEPMAIYSCYDRNDDVCRAVKGPLRAFEDFQVELERPDTVDRFSIIYTPIVLVLAIVLALVASVGKNDPLRFFWAFSAILSVSAPLGIVCAYGAGFKNVSRKLLAVGAAISGSRQANLLRGTEEVVLSETDLFPVGAIKLETVQNMGHLSDEQVLACAAALAQADGLELGAVLTEASKERYGVTMRAQQVQRVDGGIAGEVNGSKAVLGTAPLMVKMGIRMQAGQGGGQNMYLVVDGTLVGILTMQYQTTKSAYQAMRVMRRMHMNASLAVYDFNVSPAMVEGEFDLRRGYVDQLDLNDVDYILSDAYTANDVPAAILTREGAAPYIRVLRSADKLAGTVRSNLLLGAFAGICGMLIVFYLAAQNSANALAALHLLLYVLIWYVPVFLITQQTH